MIRFSGCYMPGDAMIKREGLAKPAGAPPEAARSGTPFRPQKDRATPRSTVGMFFETGINRSEELSPVLPVTFHNELLPNSVNVNHPSVEEQLVEHIHVNVVRKVCTSVANLSLVTSP